MAKNIDVNGDAGLFWSVVTVSQVKFKLPTPADCFCSISAELLLRGASFQKYCYSYSFCLISLGMYTGFGQSFPWPVKGDR